MKYSSTILTGLAKVLNALGVQEQDHEITLPPLLSPVAMVTFPLGERTIDQRWHESGYVQQGVVSNPAGGAQSFTLCTLDPGVWHIRASVSARVLVTLNGGANPGFKLLLQDPAGIGGEFYSGDWNVNPQWFPITITLREATQVIFEVGAMGAAGDVDSFICFVALRLA